MYCKPSVSVYGNLKLSPLYASDVSAVAIIMWQYFRIRLDLWYDREASEISRR